MPQRIQNREENEIPSIPNRLLNPSFKESIAHILINPLIENNSENHMRQEREFRTILKNFDSDEQERIGLRELVKVCSTPQLFSGLPTTFPRFLCGLSFVYKQLDTKNLNFTEFIFPRLSDAIRSMTNVSNYPCRSRKLTDVVALSEGRIFSGCIDDANPQKFNQFDSAFVMSHPFPTAKKDCIEHPICELRSILVQHKVLYQQEECCCEGDFCAHLIYTQTNSITPLIIKSIDLSQHMMISMSHSKG